MYRKHKETMKAYIARLEMAVRVTEAEREELWAAAHRVVRGVAESAEPVPPAVAGKVAVLSALVNKHATCGCGRHASMWQGGAGPKMCETCMST